MYCEISQLYLVDQCFFFHGTFTYISEYITCKKVIIMYAFNSNLNWDVEFYYQICHKNNTMCKNNTNGKYSRYCDARLERWLVKSRDFLKSKDHPALSIPLGLNFSYCFDGFGGFYHNCTKLTWCNQSQLILQVSICLCIKIYSSTHGTNSMHLNFLCVIFSSICSFPVF